MADWQFVMHTHTHAKGTQVPSEKPGEAGLLVHLCV